MAHWLFLPNDAIDDIETLASLPRDGLDRLRTTLDSSEFRPKYSFYVKVADVLSISDESAAKICSFINYVQTQRTRNKMPGDSIPGELEHFLSRTLENKEKGARSEKLLKYVRDNREALARLFSDLPERDYSAKVRGLETGPLPHLINFHAYCDLRPVYNVEGTEIVSCFPVITLRLATHSTQSNETKEILVQLVESDIKDFKDQFERLDKKLAKMRDKFSSLISKKGRDEK